MREDWDVTTCMYKIELEVGSTTNPGFRDSKGAAPLW